MSEVKNKYAFFKKQAAAGAASTPAASSSSSEQQAQTPPQSRPHTQPPTPSPPPAEATPAEVQSDASDTPALSATPEAASDGTPPAAASAPANGAGDGLPHAQQVAPRNPFAAQGPSALMHQGRAAPQGVTIPTREKRQRDPDPLPSSVAPAFPSNVGPSPRATAARHANGSKMAAVNTPGGNNVVFQMPKNDGWNGMAGTEAHTQSYAAAVAAHTGHTQGAGRSHYSSYAPSSSNASHAPLPSINPFVGGPQLRGKRKHSDPDLNASLLGNGRRAPAKPSCGARIGSALTAPFRAVADLFRGPDLKKDDNASSRFALASPTTIASHKFGASPEEINPSLGRRIARAFNWKNILFLMVMTLLMGGFYLWYIDDCAVEEGHVRVGGVNEPIPDPTSLERYATPEGGGGHLHQELNAPLNPASEPGGVVASWIGDGSLEGIEQRYPFLHPVLHFFKRPTDHAAPAHKHVVTPTDPSVPFTLVSLLRDMTPEFLAENKASYIFQYNSLLSWVRLTPHIIVYMDSQDSCTQLTARKEFRGVQCFAVPCMHDAVPRPLLNCIFDHAHSVSTTEAMGFVNGDIILSPAVLPLVTKIGNQFEKYLVVSRRTDTHLPEWLIDAYIANYHARDRSDRTGAPFVPAVAFDETTGQKHIIRDNVDSAIAHAKATAVLHSEWGIDLFLYPKSTFKWMFPAFPPFLAGVYRWDNYFLTKMILHPEVATVDASQFGLLVHQQVDGGKDHGKRSGAAINDALVKAHLGSVYKIGHIKNVDFVLKEDDQAIVPNPEASVQVLYAKRATPDGWVALVHVNGAEHIELNNFVCWANRIGFRSFIFLTRDREMYEEIMKRDLPVIFLDRELVEAPGAKGAIQSDVESAASTLQRYDFLFSVLKAGYHFFYTSVRGVFLNDPLRALQATTLAHPLSPADAAAVEAAGGQILYDVQIRANATDVLPPPFAGPVAVRSSTYGQYFWKQVHDCADMNRHIADSAQWIDCIGHNFKVLKGGVKKGYLSPFLFTDADSFFNAKESLINGYYPAVVSDQSVAENVDKFARLQTWGMMASHASSPVCKDDLPSYKAGVFKPPTDKPELDFRLKVRVLTFNRYASLKRLLDILQTAHYDNDRVDLEISIDYPLNMTDKPMIDEWTQTQLTARSFVWNHGKVEVIQQRTHIGLTGQWTQGWYPADDNREIMLFLEDDTGVSPYYYLWCKRMIQTYYLNPANYDPSLYGFALQTQHTILGETLAARYGTRTVPNLLNATHMERGTQGIDNEYFRYQLVGTWGGVFFPQHWREFLIWLREKQFVHAEGTSPSFKPCVPGLVSNAWWAKKPHKVWSQWFVRFAFEKGWYNMYTNFPDQLSLVGNFREGGENFAITKGLMNEMVDAVNTPPGSPLYERILHDPLPVPSSRIPLYDLHFNEITAAGAEGLKSRLAVWGNPNLVPQCTTMAELQKAKKEAAAAEKAKLERQAREEKQRQKDKSEAAASGLLSKLENTMADLESKKALPADAAKKAAAATAKKATDTKKAAATTAKGKDGKAAAAGTAKKKPTAAAAKKAADAKKKTTGKPKAAATATKAKAKPAASAAKKKADAAATKKKTAAKKKEEEEEEEAAVDEEAADSEEGEEASTEEGEEGATEESSETTDE